MAPMKDKRHYLSACSINEEFIYAFGGFFGSTEQEINDTIEVYEVEKNVWNVLTVRMKVILFFNFSFRTLSGLVAPWRSALQKLSWSEARTQIATVKFIFSMSQPRLGNPYTLWINFAYHTRVSSSKTRSTLLVATMTWAAKCTT